MGAGPGPDAQVVALLSQHESTCMAIEAALCEGSPMSAGLTQLLTHDPGRC